MNKTGRYYVSEISQLQKNKYLHDTIYTIDLKLSNSEAQNGIMIARDWENRETERW